MQFIISIIVLIIILYVSAISSINTYLSSIQHLKYMIFSANEFEKIEFKKWGIGDRSEFTGIINNHQIHISSFTNSQIKSINKARHQGDKPEYVLHLVCIRQIHFLNPLLTYYIFSNFEVIDIKKEEK